MIREERNALLLLVAFTGAASLLYLLVLRPALEDATRPVAPRPETAAAAETEAERRPIDARPKSARRMLGLEALLVDAVTGRPRSDAEVKVTRVEDIAEPTASLGADGTLRVDHLPPDITFGVEIECDGYEPRSFPRLRGEAREVLSLGVVALEPRRRARVTVRDEDESPVDRARVTLHPRDDVAPNEGARSRAARVAEALLLPAVATAATDADGVAVLRDLPARHALAVVSSGERPTVAHEVDVFGGDVSEPVTLGPGVPFRGRAVDAGGAPIAGARVVLVEARDGPGPGLSTAVTDTDDDGHFTAPQVSPVPHFVFVVAPARAAVALGPYPPGGRDAVVLAVPDGAAVEGTLRSRTGRRPPAVEVIGRSDVPGAVSLRTRTAEDGSFALDHLAVGHATLTVLAEGFAPERAVVPVASFGAEVDLRLDPPARLVGTVTSDGRPRSGAVVRDLAGGRRAVTDVDGSFRLDGLAAGMVRLETRAARHAPRRTEAEVLLREESSTEIELAPGGELPVVVRSADGEARPGARVAAHAVLPSGRLAPVPRSSATADAAGVARLANLRPEEPIVLFGRAAGHAPSRSSPIEVDPELTEAGVELTLGVGGPVEGVVLAPDGTPAGGAVVTALPAAGPAGTHAFGPRSARTGDDGRFRLARLPAGRVRLLAVRGEERALGAPIAVRNGARTGAIELTLAPVPALAGRVLDAEGRPVPGASVTLLEAAPGDEGGDEAAEAPVVPATAYCDAAGRFVLQPLRRVELVVEATTDAGTIRTTAPPGATAVELRP